MACDPLAAVQDAPLFIVPRVLAALETYRADRAEAALDALPGDDASGARTRLLAELDGLVGRLLAGVERQPTKFWVMKQFQASLDALDGEPAAVGKQVRTELERLMDILGIASSDGLLGHDFR